MIEQRRDGGTSGQTGPERPTRRRSSPRAAPPRRSIRRTRQSVLLLAFLLILYLPSVGLIVQPHRSQAGAYWQQSEHRPFPQLAWQWSSVLSFPRGLGDYFAVNFGFRRNLIRWHTTIAEKILGQSSSTGVLEGKDGWLFYGASKTVEDYRGLLPFTPAQLQHWQQALESRRDWLARRGAHYLFVICPDKHSIYPEFMPDRINRVQPQTRLDQFVGYMKEHSDLEILDLRPALRRLKQEHLCYQPQDTHWNDIGAFVGYQQIVRRLDLWYPDLHPLEMKDCEFCQRENPYTDLRRLQGQKNVKTMMDSLRPVRGFRAQQESRCDRPTEERRQVTQSRCPGAPGGKLLFVHDSFGSFIAPFLAEHFREALFVYGGGDSFLAQDVLACQPDVVIQEIVERGLCDVKPKVLKDLASE